ncbi:S41 family peptidase [Phaeocystidibacter marisrubri]|uniref:S41 family peptidase n=1 Tax=Phaeocystidibacter marisrubri TaxID=1577780 RepID=A0A6L3ZEY5_9FLAO|nr:S41 family peptidase [Phaeocystidibacter marisrubri]KAB2816166.1 S41 family peptidase [Phaeocystidibacter marisrubri]GGH67657.1 peptidase S41 [Phaeocystidibacter marisrubri]
MKARQIYLPMIIAAAVVVGMFVGSRYNYPARPNEESKQQKIRQIIDYIDYKYVVDVNTDSLLDLTIRDMLHKLDPHSSYISQRDVQAQEESIQGSFDGVGIEFRVRKDTVTVIRVIPEGPAMRAGLKAGDRIIAIDDLSVIGDYETTAPLVETLRGPSGEEVYVEVMGRGETLSRSIAITRGPIPIHSVDVSYMLNDSVGLVKVNRFADNTMDEFNFAIRSLERQGMNTLILDLRDNPGGLLESAKDMADAFLSEGKTIVYTVDRDGEKHTSTATNRGIFEYGEVVVLVNESSASASEVVAGALQDNDRAIIVGRRTFGKGLVQQEMSLNDGSRMRLTTSKYYTPTGRSIQKPYDNGYDAYQMDNIQRIEDGELFRPDSSKFDHDERFVTEGGKVVYGGGGIMPDIFVPIDSSIFTYGMLYHQFGYSRLSDFAFDYVDSRRAEFGGVNRRDFIDSWNVPQDLYLELLEKLDVLKYEERIDDEMRAFIELRLKAVIAETVWGKDGYYPVVFQTDPVIKSALLSVGAYSDTIPRPELP